MTAPVTPSTVEDRMRDAALVVDALPDHILPQEYFSSWPEPVREQISLFTEGETGIVPTPRQIDECFEALDWLRYQRS